MKTEKEIKKEIAKVKNQKKILERRIKSYTQKKGFSLFILLINTRRIKSLEYKLSILKWVLETTKPVRTNKK